MSTTLLGRALERSRRAAEFSGGAILVGLSGGKDSLATLDVVVRSGAFSRVEAFSMYLVPGLELFERPVRRAAERYGIPVHFVPHWDLGRLLKVAVLRPHIIGAEKLRQSKAKDVQRALTKRTGIEWFAYGERGGDSYARWFFTHHRDGVRDDHKRLYPIWDWKTAEVLTYLRLRRIPIPARLGARRVSGVDLQPETLAHIKANHPADYRRILEIFPLAELQVLRFERGKHGDQKETPEEQAGSERDAGAGDTGG